MFGFWKWTEYEYRIVLFGPNYSNNSNSDWILIVSIENLDRILNTEYIRVLKMDRIRISNTTIRSSLFEYSNSSNNSDQHWIPSCSHNDNLSWPFYICIRGQNKWWHEAHEQSSHASPVAMRAMIVQSASQSRLGDHDENLCIQIRSKIKIGQGTKWKYKGARDV